MGTFRPNAPSTFGTGTRDKLPGMKAAWDRLTQEIMYTERVHREIKGYEQNKPRSKAQFPRELSKDGRFQITRHPTYVQINEVEGAVPAGAVERWAVPDHAA